MVRPSVQLFLFFLGIYLFQKAGACTTDSLTSNLAVLIRDAFQRAAPQGTENPTVSNVMHQIVCLTTGTTRGTYSSASVIASYTCTGLACPLTGDLQQFEFACDTSVSTNMWTLPNPPNSFNTVPVGNLTTPRRTDCGQCVQGASGFGSQYDSVTRCIACDPSCNTGLMECTDITSGDCCIGVENNMCVSSCTAPARPLDSADYECTVFCDPLSDPDNGNITFSSGLLVDSVATYSCRPNFEIQGGVNRTCEVVGSATMWSGAAPSCMMVVTVETTMPTEEPTMPTEEPTMSTEEPTTQTEEPIDTSSATTVTSTDSTDNALSIGVIIGIVVAIVVVALTITVVIVGVLVYWIRSTKTANKQ